MPFKVPAVYNPNSTWSLQSEKSPSVPRTVYPSSACRMKAPPAYKPISASAAQRRTDPPAYRPQSHDPGREKITPPRSAQFIQRNTAKPTMQPPVYRPNNATSMQPKILLSQRENNRSLPQAPMTRPSCGSRSSAVLQLFRLIGGGSYLGGFPSFGTPITPYLTPATKDQVYLEAQHDPSKAHLFQPTFGGPVWKYKCIYCEGDPLVNTPDACWHERGLTQVDHIYPWSTIIANPGTYYPGINALSQNHMQAAHNDLDNLRIVCTGHNATAKKGGNSGYNTKILMGIPFLVHHKQKDGRNDRSVYDFY